MSDILCIGGNYNGKMVKYLGPRPMLNRQQYIQHKVVYFDGTWSECYIMQGATLRVQHGCIDTIERIEVMG